MDDVLADARQALKAGQLDAAATRLKQFVRTNPRHGEAWYLLGQALTDPNQKADCAFRAGKYGYTPPAPTANGAAPADGGSAQPAQHDGVTPPVAPTEQALVTASMAGAPVAASARGRRNRHSRVYAVVEKEPVSTGAAAVAGQSTNDEPAAEVEAWSTNDEPAAGVEAWSTNVEPATEVAERSTNIAPGSDVTDWSTHADAVSHTGGDAGDAEIPLAGSGFADQPPRFAATTGPTARLDDEPRMPISTLLPTLAPTASSDAPVAPPTLAASPAVPVSGTYAYVMPSEQAGLTNVAGYGGFWRRFLAFLIDAFIVAIPVGVVNSLVGRTIASNGLVNATGAGALGLISGTVSVAVGLSLVINWLYFALFESSARGATPGKMVLNLRVTDLEGRRISFARATGRHFGKIISSAILMIGYLMAAFTERKQALHDLIASTLVVRLP